MKNKQLKKVAVAQVLWFVDDFLWYNGVSLVFRVTQVGRGALKSDLNVNEFFTHPVDL